MKLFLSALCLCASGLLIFVSYKLIYAYTMIDQFHDASLKWIEALKGKDEDLFRQAGIEPEIWDQKYGRKQSSPEGLPQLERLLRAPLHPDAPV